MDAPVRALLVTEPYRRYEEPPAMPVGSFFSAPLFDGEPSILHFHDNDIYEHHRIETIQRFGLPSADIFDGTVSDMTDQCKGYTNIVHFLDGGNDLTGAHALAVQENSLAVEYTTPDLFSRFFSMRSLHMPPMKESISTGLMSSMPI